MNKTITTIIPFYNSGDSLARMLDSILAGTVLPTEILLIDDGSTDGSEKLAQEYANQNPIIKYIRQEHLGVSAARNHGIESASCAWISFMDADDFIESDMYEQMLASINDENIAGCVCGYFTEKDGVTTPYIGHYAESITASELLKSMFTDDNIRGFLFTRLFNASLVKRYHFKEGITMCEDMLYQSTLLSANLSEKFIYVNKPLYHYVQNSSSATSSINLFNQTTFKYKPAFDLIRNLVPERYVDDSYSSIMEYSMYCLLKEYKKGNTATIPQIRMLQNELKNVHPTSSSKRRFAYIYAPLLYSKFMRG